MAARALWAIATALALACVARAQCPAGQLVVAGSASSGPFCVQDNWRLIIRESGSRAVTSTLINSGATGAFPVTPCGEFSAWAGFFVVRLTMGTWVDYFIPTSTATTLCSMLTSRSLHLWSHDLRAVFRTPTYEDTTAFLGGSELTPAGVNSLWSADSRTSLNYWGSNAGQLGGGGFTQSTVPTEGFSWGRAFEMHIAVGVSVPLPLPTISTTGTAVSIIVSWTPLLSPNLPVANFTIRYSPNADMSGAMVASSPAGTTSTTITAGIVRNTQYWVQVQQWMTAASFVGEVAWSSPVASMTCGVMEMVFFDLKGLPRCYHANMEQIATNPGNIEFTATSYINGNAQITSCRNYDALTDFVFLVRMGIYDDYFAASDMTTDAENTQKFTLCDVLSTFNRHVWSQGGSMPFRTFTPYSTHLGGSAASWPVNNGYGSRTYLSFWGSPGILGGW